MKCPKCNEEIANTAKFCTKCGANIEEVKKAEEERKIEENGKVIEELKCEETKKEIEKTEVKENKTEVKNNAKKEKSDKPKEKTELKEQKNEEKLEEENEKEVVTEKGKTKKKKHILLKLILILIFLVILFLAGSYGLYRIELLPDSVKEVLLPVYELFDDWLNLDKKEEKEKVIENNISNEVEEEAEKINLIDEDKELVYDCYNKKIAGHEYKVPAINLDYDNIKDINKEILNLVESDLKQLEKVTELPEGAISRTDYKWYQNKEILSVVFFIEGYHVDDYYVYNIDIYTGEEVKNEKILEAEKIDEDEFPEMCSDAVEDYFENYLYSASVAQSAGSVYEDAKDKSTDEDNFKISKTDMFLGENGNLYIVAEVTTIAGAGYNNFLINIENLRKNSKEIFAENISGNVVNNTTNTDNTNITNTVTNNVTNVIN